MVKTASVTPRFKCKAVPLHTPRKYRLCDSFQNWVKAPPFACNPRGQLIHRVRDAATVLWSGEPSHIGIGFLCGNQMNCGIEEVDKVLVADPPKGKLLCVRCELMAQAKNLPSGNDLAGRHVHRGTLVATQVCCLNPKDRK